MSKEKEGFAESIESNLKELECDGCGYKIVFENRIHLTPDQVCSLRELFEELIDEYASHSQLKFGDGEEVYAEYTKKLEAIIGEEPPSTASTDEKDVK